MRLEIRELGIELQREGRAYLEYAVFAALRQFLPQIGLVNICLRHTGKASAAVTCVMAAHLLPSGRAVVVCRANHPYAAIERAAAALQREIQCGARTWGDACSTAAPFQDEMLER